MDLAVVYSGLNENLDDLKAKIEDLEKEADVYTQKLNEINTQLQPLKSLFESVQMAKEALDMSGRFKETQVINRNDSKKGADTNKSAKLMQLKWTRKDPWLVRKDRNGQLLGKYGTQKAAAREIGWDQSSISRFLKFSKEQQIAKKNFYFEWEY